MCPHVHQHSAPLRGDLTCFTPQTFTSCLILPSIPFVPPSLPLPHTPPSFFFYIYAYYTTIQFFISNKSPLFSQITCLS